MKDNNLHYTKCDEQPDGFHCICDYLEEEQEKLYEDLQDNLAGGN